MRTLFAVAVIAVLAVSAAAGPRLAVDPEIYDFGTVVAGIMVQATFTITNSGDAPLIFPRPPGTSCGCTSAPLPKTELEPGESLQLIAYFDSTAYGGRQVRKYVYLYSNDPQAPRKTLTITGNVLVPYPYQSSASTLAWNLYLLVDLRAPEEYARCHLLGAVNIPASELESRLGLLPRQFPIYLYDDTGKLALQAADMLSENGFLAARPIQGGLSGWWRDVGDAYIVWAPGEEHVPPAGSPIQSGLNTQPRYLADRYLTIVDFRPQAAFAAGHFPGAANIDLTDIAAWEAALPPTPQGITIWCIDDTGTTACAAAKWLRAHGRTKSYCMIGGLGQWRLRYGELALWRDKDVSSP